MTEQKKRRPEDGRPRITPGGVKRVNISLPVELLEDFKALGGSKWVREQIEKELAKRNPKG